MRPVKKQAMPPAESYSLTADSLSFPTFGIPYGIILPRMEKGESNAEMGLFIYSGGL